MRPITDRAAITHVLNTQSDGLAHSVVQCGVPVVDRGVRFHCLDVESDEQQ